MDFHDFYTKNFYGAQHKRKLLWEGGRITRIESYTGAGIIIPASGVKTSIFAKTSTLIGKALWQGSFIFSTPTRGY
jgi:hypothetical protein